MGNNHNIKRNASPCHDKIIIQNPTSETRDIYPSVSTHKLQKDQVMTR